MSKVKLGIIGIGNMGSGHCKSLMEGKVPDIDLVAVADRAQKRRDWAAENLPAEVKVFDEGLELINSGLCDAIIIATPHYQHPVLAQQAFAAGLHVMCEKPAGVYTKQVIEMNEAAKKSGKVFAMMFNQRTNCIYRKLKEFITEGKLGEIRRVNWIITDWFRTQMYYDSGEWRGTWNGEGGGVLLNQCPHQLDLMQWLFGMPVSVKAFVNEGKWHDIEVEDDVTAYFEYANGASGVFITSTGDYPGTNRLEVSFDKGKIICEKGKITLYELEDFVSDIIKKSDNGFARIPMTVSEVETDGENLQHVGVLRAFAANILRDEPLVADGYEGINGLMLSNAMHLSSWLDQPIAIPVDENQFLEELNKRRASSRPKEGVDVTFDTTGSY